MSNSVPNILSLDQLAHEFGEEVSCGYNAPVSLNDSNSFWFVESGSVNLFLVESENGDECSSLQHLMQLEAGKIMLGVTPDRSENEANREISVIVKGTIGTKIRRISVDLMSQLDPTELALHVDTWINEVSITMSRFVILPPRPTVLAEPDSQMDINLGTLSVRRGVVWILGLPKGSSLYLDLVDAIMSFDKSISVPLTPTSWVSVFSHVRIECRSTKSLFEQGLLMEMIAVFHRLVFALEHINRKLALVDEANLERARYTSRQTIEKNARQRLFNIYDLPVEQTEDEEHSSLIQALIKVGEFDGIIFNIPKRIGLSKVPICLTDILNASGVRARQVTLSMGQKWWQRDAGPLLAVTKSGNQYVALLPNFFGRYRMISQDGSNKQIVTASLAKQLQPKAWMFYPPLPQTKSSLADLFRLSMRHSSGDVLQLLGSGLLIGILFLVPAVGLGLLAHLVETNGSIDRLYLMVVIIIVAGVIATLLSFFKDKSLMKLESRIFIRAEAAFWDRVLRLPKGELQNQSNSDLAMSSLIFQKIREGAQAIVANSILSVIFMFPILMATLFYDIYLGSVILIFSMLSLVIVVLLGCRQIASKKLVINATRGVTSKLFQIIMGIVKLRIELAEGSAYAVWAEEYRKQKSAEIEHNKYQRHTKAFASALPFLGLAIILIAVAVSPNSNFATADFIVIYTIFFIYQTAVARFSDSFGEFVAAILSYQQLDPVLVAQPEIEDLGEQVEYLGGSITFDRVSFRYQSDGPLILDDVTIRANPGEFIAIAGASGAGKSTLFQLMLGLKRPTSGAVFYDGRDLINLNLKQLRRKIGSVPQSVKLHPQDIWDNVVGGNKVENDEEVWESLRIAGIDAEIKRMQMGLMMPIGLSGSVLSGGEGQRVSIAQALLGKPRILLLDEATNWLDNVSQAIFMQNLATLTATRIVIAHRLSTLVKADRIYVLQSGKVVQEGNYNELSEVDGVFRDLIQRQIA